MVSSALAVSRRPSSVLENALCRRPFRSCHAAASLQPYPNMQEPGLLFHTNCLKPIQDKNVHGNAVEVRDSLAR